MTPISHIATRDASDAICQHNLDTHRSWTLALSVTLLVFSLAYGAIIFVFARAYKKARSNYLCMKQQHDIAVSERSYYASYADTLECRLNRLKKDLQTHEQYLGRVPRLAVHPVDESADPADGPMDPGPTDPFVVGDEESEYEYDNPVVNTARAQQLTPAKPRRTSVFTDGSSPRPLIMTPGTSHGSSGKSKSRQPSHKTSFEAPMEMREFVTPIQESGRPSRRDLRASRGSGRADAALAPVRGGRGRANAALVPSPLRQSFGNLSETTVAEDVAREYEEDDEISTFSGLHADNAKRTGFGSKYHASVEDAPLSPPADSLAADPSPGPQHPFTGNGSSNIGKAV